MSPNICKNGRGQRRSLRISPTKQPPLLSFVAYTTRNGKNFKVVYLNGRRVDIHWEGREGGKKVESDKGRKGIASLALSSTRFL